MRVYRSLLILTLFVSISFGVFLSIQQANAATAMYTLNINSLNGLWPPPSAVENPVELEGNFSVISGSGNEKQYGIQIDWGDDSPSTIFRWYDPDNAYPYMTWSPNDQSAQTFNGTFNTNPGGEYQDLGHIYAAEGIYNISVKLFHEQLGGNPGSVVVVSLSEHVLVAMLNVFRSAPIYGHEGDIIDYNVTVTNPSMNTPMYKTSVIDSIFGDISGDFSGLLNPQQSESRTYNYTIPSPSGSMINSNVTASYHDAANHQLTVSAIWNVSVLHPDIEVTKAGPAYAHQGDIVNYNTTIINTGDCPLYDITVIDTLMGSTSLNTLPTGQNYTFVFAYLIPSTPQVNNTAIVSGSDALGWSTSANTSMFTTVQYQITVAASPDGANGGTFNATYTEDGTTYTNVGNTTTWTEWVDSGTNVTISGPQEIVTDGPGIRYGFDHYYPSISVIMNGSTNLTLAYKTQYYLTVVSSYGTSTGEGWYNESDTAYATLANGTVDITPGQMRVVFTEWRGNASGSNLISDPILIDAPKTAAADWKTQHLITVISAHDTPTNSDWVDQGGNFIASVTSPTEVIPNDNQWVSTGYSVDGGHSQVGTSYNLTDVQTAHNITFTWKQQFWIQIESAHDSPTSSQWIDRGGNLTTSVGSPTDDDGNGTRYRCTGYTLDINSPITDGSTAYNFSDVQTAHTITFSWIAQYRLTVTSEHDSPIPATGEHWYDSGDAVSASVTSPADDNAEGTRYKSTGWTGAGSVPTDGTSLDLTFNITSPSTLTWNWIAQYYLTVISDHDSPTGEGWYDTGSNVSLSVVSLANESAYIRYAVTEFMGMGSAPSRGTGTQVSFQISAPSSILWNWKTQYLVTFNQDGLDSSAAQEVVTVDGSVKTHDSLPFQLWIDENSRVSYLYQTAVSSSTTGKRFILSSTTGGASPIYVTTPLTVVGRYRIQFYLTVTSAHDTPTPESRWFENGTLVDASVTSPSSDSAGTRYIGLGWNGTGSVPASGTQNSLWFVISEASNLTWNWKTQYYLALSTNLGTVGPSSGWFDEGSVVSINSTAPTVSGTQGLHWYGWTSQGTGSYTGLDNPASVTVNGPINASSYWKIIPSLTISVSDETVARCDRIVVYGTTSPVNSTVELEITYTFPGGKQITHTVVTDESGHYDDVLLFENTNPYGVFTQSGQWTISVNRQQDINHDVAASYATMGIKGVGVNLFVLAVLAVSMTAAIVAAYLWIEKRVKDTQLKQNYWRKATVILGLTGLVLGIIASFPNWMSVQGTAVVNGQTYFADFGLNPFSSGPVSIAGIKYVGTEMPSLISSAWSNVPKNPGPIVTLYLLPIGCALTLVSLYRPKTKQEKRIKILMLTVAGAFVLMPIVSSIIFMAVQSSWLTGASTGYAIGLFVAMVGGLATLLSGAFAEREPTLQTLKQAEIPTSSPKSEK